MPLNTAIHKVMVIGSGPIVIGQAAEFDYAGTQACKALKEQGLSVVLVNSNPATLMTDTDMADAVYIEPLIPETIQRIIEKEKPDSLLSTLGGQTGLTLSMELAKSGFLEAHGVTLLGARPETIDKAEDRQRFKDTMHAIGVPCVPYKVVTTVTDALSYADNEIGYPVIVRPAFTLGGTGGGMAYTHDELETIAANGLHRSPIHQVLIEKNIAGWKEIEFEVMRDKAGNAITVCSMENVDPVGVHTGDSIVVAPAMTLADKEYQMLRSAALNIIHSLNMEGGCNVQFALHPQSFEYAVIEVNPRVSRSSALASKATGYPIAKVATLVAIGYTLDEIPNFVTGKTAACFEPALDYVVVKMPRFPFDKFVYAKRELGTQMQATGEVMAIAHSFEAALMKAVRGAEIGVESLCLPEFAAESDERIVARVGECTDRRIFAIREALWRGLMTMDAIHAVTQIDIWFIAKIQHLVDREMQLAAVKAFGGRLSVELYREAKKDGFPDAVIERLTGVKIPATPPDDVPPARQAKLSARKTAADSATGKAPRTEERVVHIPASYKMVDTCAGEFNAETPYFYASTDEENEAALFVRRRRKKGSKGTVLVLGSGPIRIGQGIEFDYASVQCVWALKRFGYDVVTVNNNPETVSTDFDTADRLYFEPLTGEDVMDVIQTERPIGVVVAFGGGTAIKLAKFLDGQGVRILGTSADAIDLAEDRGRFDALCERLGINRPRGETVLTVADALAAAARIGYPVLLRPSYVLGGQNMIIAFNDDDVKEYMAIILAHGIENPLLIDKYMMGVELEIDAISDGHDILIPGIMEHIERTGIHSGDSIAMYPARNVNDAIREKIVTQSRQLARALGTRGLVNIQYLIYNNDIYVIEVNPRSSRTVPYISKVACVPMVDLAVRAMLGEKIAHMGYGTGLYRTPPYYAVKVPVFSFEKLMGVDTHLGPEMKSTGEVLGVAPTFAAALYKGLVAAGYRMKKTGGVLLTVREMDHFEIPDVARKFYDLGFSLYATDGTAEIIRDFGMEVTVVNKIHENPDNNVLTVLETGNIDYVISTSTKGRHPQADSVRMRRYAVEHDIPCLTSIDTAHAVADCLMSLYTAHTVALVDVKKLRREKEKIRFFKMESAGNDFIVIDAMAQHVENPAGLTVQLCNRRTGIGADSLVTVLPSTVADAAMRFFNRDGSEGTMAGNAIRAVAKYLYDFGGVRCTRNSAAAPAVPMTVETVSGVRQLTLYKQNGRVSSVRVNMGTPQFSPDAIPITLAVPDGSDAASTRTRAIVTVSLTVSGVRYDGTCLSVAGTPHCVVFCDIVEKLPLSCIGPQFECHAAFPDRINAEFVRVISQNELQVRVWERGNGETPSCGNGAAAAAVAAIMHGHCPENEDITVKMRGGKLVVRYDAAAQTVSVMGAVKLIYEGTVEV